jgi:hypothetical protein
MVLPRSLVSDLHDLLVSERRQEHRQRRAQVQQLVPVLALPMVLLQLLALALRHCTPLVQVRPPALRL